MEKDLIQKEENGQKISPILPSHIKNYLIDIDGTVCDDIPNEEPERMPHAKVYPDALETLNKWFDEGHIITFFTSRTEAHRIVTEKWLADNNFKYHGLLNKDRVYIKKENKNSKAYLKKQNNDMFNYFNNP